MGDSRSIIEWDSNRCNLQVISLEHWKYKVKNVLAGFIEVEFKHILREYNKEVDILSEKALQSEEGKLKFIEMKNGISIISHTPSLS